jgi:hypothetical protein
MSDDSLEERVSYKMCGTNFSSKTSNSTGYLTRHAKKNTKKMKKENSLKYKLVLILKVTLVLNIMILKLLENVMLGFLKKITYHMIFIQMKVGMNILLLLIVNIKMFLGILKEEILLIFLINLG